MNSLENWIKAAQDWLVANGLTYASHLIGALVVFLIGKWLAGMLANVAGTALRRSRVEETLVRFFRHFINIFVLVTVVLAALEMVGIRTTSVVAFLGAAGLAVGLAMQGSLSNFAAGVLIILFRPFRVGDFIETEKATGTVEDISVFTTYLLTPDNRLVIVPNSTFTSGIITNHSSRDTRRLELTFSVSYQKDLATAKEIIWRVLKSEPRILGEPKPTVGIGKLGETTADFMVWPWVKVSDLLDVKFYLNETIKRELAVAGF